MPLLTPLTAQQRLALCTAFASVKARPGQAVVTRGDPGNTFYVIEEGSCVVEGEEGQVGGARGLPASGAAGALLLAGLRLHSLGVAQRVPRLDVTAKM